MPELPEIVVYIEPLESGVGGQPFEGARIVLPLLVRTVESPLEACAGKRLLGSRRTLSTGRRSATF